MPYHIGLAAARLSRRGRVPDYILKLPRGFVSQDIHNFQTLAAGVLTTDISVPGQSDAVIGSYTDSVANSVTNDYM